MKSDNKNKSALKTLLFDIKNWDVIVCFLIIFILFFQSLFRPWLIYDERTIYEGFHFGSPTSIGELFEFIENFGLNFNIISSNLMYSSNYVTRTSPFGQLLGTILSLLFKKIPLLWHLFNLTMHLINSFLVFLILKSFIIKDKTKKASVTQRLILVLLTLIWAAHPLNTEPVLLGTNFGALFSYMFFFSFLLDFILNREINRNSLYREFLIPIIFLIPMLTNEYIVTIPFVLFIISFWMNYKEFNFKKALNLSFKETRPYFYGLLLYCLYFVFLTNFKTSYSLEQNSLAAFLERIFWLAPQIFFHFIKLILFPLKLSIDQTIFVKLGHSIFDPYSLFCILFFILWLALPLFYFLKYKKLANVFMITWSFFFALMPFLHILMPSYTLAAERYLYAPLMLLVLGAGIILSELNIKNQKLVSISALSVLSIILILCLCRSYIRTLDWKNNQSFINSTYLTNTDPLFKAMRLGMLAKCLTIINPERSEEIKNYFRETITLLNQAEEKVKSEKNKYQNSLPRILKVYGLDYDSLLSKIAFLQTSSIYIELQGDYKTALKTLKSHVKIPETTDPRILELYANLLIQDKKFKKAEKILLTANKIYPNSNFILGDLFDYYITYKKDYKSAEKYINEALRLYHHDPFILLKAVSFYQEIKNPVLTSYYAYLHGLRTRSKTTYQIALSNFLISGNVRGAQKTINKLVTLDPTDPETLYFVSKYYYQLKDYQKALSFLTEAYNQTKRPNINKEIAFDITHNLAKLYLFLGNKDIAAKLSTEAFNLAESKEAFMKLASFYKTLGLNKEMQLCISRLRTAKG